MPDDELIDEGLDQAPADDDDGDEGLPPAPDDDDSPPADDDDDGSQADDDDEDEDDDDGDEDEEDDDEDAPPAPPADEPVKFHGRDDRAIAQSILHLQHMLGLTPDPLSLEGAGRSDLIHAYQQLEAVIGYPEDVRPFVMQEMGLIQPEQQEQGEQPGAPIDDPIYPYANAEYQRLYRIERARLEAAGLFDEEIGLPDEVNQAISDAAYSYGREKYLDAQRTAPILRQMMPEMIKRDVSRIVPLMPDVTSLQLSGEEIAAEIQARLDRGMGSPEEWQQATDEQRAYAIQEIAKQMIVDRYRSGTLTGKTAPAGPPKAPKQKPPGSLRETGSRRESVDPADETVIAQVMATTGLSRKDAMAAIREGAKNK